ncbi:MAG: hypothetical protein ACREBV_00730 [Candidatus Zixiibacteriota bacterium]
MKSYFLKGIIIILAIVGVAISCQKDIVLEPLPSLEGIYEGKYLVITGRNTASPDTTWSTIEMVFSDESYFFNSDNTPGAFCDPRGDYILEANFIEFTETNKNCTQIAKEKDNPRGRFGIRRAQPDSLIITQLDSAAFKQFLLTEQ